MVYIKKKIDDFNNIVGIILGNTELAMLNLDKEDPVCDYLDEVRLACNRAKDVVMQIFAFSRKSDREHTVVHVNHLINDTGHGISPRIMERIYDPLRKIPGLLIWLLPI